MYQKCLSHCVLVLENKKSLEWFKAQSTFLNFSGSTSHIVGQPQFHEVFPAFIGNTIDITFVMKLSEKLDEDPVVNVTMKVGIGIVNLIIMHLVMNRL